MISFSKLMKEPGAVPRSVLQQLAEWADDVYGRADLAVLVVQKVPYIERPVLEYLPRGCTKELRLQYLWRN